MEKRVETFLDECLPRLKDNINKFLEFTPGKLHEIIFKINTTSSFVDYIALVIYTPQEEEDEKRRKRKEKNKKSDEGIQGKFASFWEQRRPACY